MLTVCSVTAVCSVQTVCCVNSLISVLTVSSVPAVCSVHPEGQSCRIGTMRDGGILKKNKNLNHKILLFFCFRSVYLCSNSLRNNWTIFQTLVRLLVRIFVF